MESRLAKGMLFSTHFCRWETEIQPDLVKTASSNPWLPAGLYARYYSCCSRVSRRGCTPTAWHCNTNHPCERLSWDAGMRAGEADVRVHVPSWLWAAPRGILWLRKGWKGLNHSAAFVKSTSVKAGSSKQIKQLAQGRGGKLCQHWTKSRSQPRASSTRFHLGRQIWAAQCQTWARLYRSLFYKPHRNTEAKEVKWFMQGLTEKSTLIPELLLQNICLCPFKPCNEPVFTSAFCYCLQKKRARSLFSWNLFLFNSGGPKITANFLQGICSLKHTVWHFSFSSLFFFFFFFFLVSETGTESVENM